MKYKIEYYFGNIYHNLDKMIAANELSGKRIIIFGTAFPSRMIFRYLHKRNVLVESFCDNSEKSINSIVEGIKVCHPSKIIREDNSIVLIASSHQESMRNQMLSLGYTEKQLINVIDYNEIKADLLKGLEQYKLLNLRQIQVEELEMLKYIKQICDENNLTYYLCAGTMLGAIRHNGFIPWDDDIDISMPYTDYLKFLDIMETDEKYHIYNHRTCEGYRWGFSQMINPNIRGQQIGYPIPAPIGLFVDIFPIYSLPDDEDERNRVIEENRTLKDKMKNVCNFQVDPRDFVETRDKLISLWEQIGYYPTKKVMRTCVGAAGYFEEEFVSYDAYDGVDMVKFEDELFPVPKGYHEVLTRLYGNYMELPPMEKRKGHHSCVFYKLGE